MDKAPFLAELERFARDLRELKRVTQAITSPRISRLAIRNQADELATRWVETIRPPLEHRFGIAKEEIEKAAECAKRLHRLSRPNNHRTSYLETLGDFLERFDDRFVLPVKQMPGAVDKVSDLRKLTARIPVADMSDYLTEAIDCAAATYYRAAIVLGWCAAVDKLQSVIQVRGFAAFNNASKAVKAQTSGRYKHWNKEFSVSTLAELQEVFDTDLLVVLEGMGLFDSNQTDRLRVCFEYRNQSAHPGLARIGEPHLIAFFTDIVDIVLANPRL